MGCHQMFLVVIPVFWWCCPRLVLGRGVLLYTTRSLSFSWPHYSVSGMLGTPFLPGVCGHWCAGACVVSCRTVCPPSVGCRSIYSPLWGLLSTHIIAYRRERRLQLVVLCLLTGDISSSCKCVTLACLGWPSGVLWGGPLICGPVVAAVW